MPFKMQLEIPKNSMFNKNIRDIFNQEVSYTLNDGIEEFRNQIISRTPIGATKMLVNSIKTSVKDNQASVFTGAKPYDVIVERGRRAAPIAKSADQDLLRWLRLSKNGQKFVKKIRSSMSQKGKEVSNETVLRSALFLLKRSKAKKPTKGKFFFRSGVKAGKKITKDFFFGFNSRLMKRLRT